MSLELKTIKEEIGVFEINYEELKKELSNEIQLYQNMIVTEDTLESAKEMKAKLSKLDTVINDWRIKKEKEFMQPFSNVKVQIKELNAMIKEAYNNLNSQIQSFTEREKEEKKEQIITLWNKNVPDIFPFILEEVFIDKWLNKSYNLSTIEKDINDIIKKTYEDYNFISSEFPNIEKLAKYYYAKNGRNVQNAILQAQEQEKAIHGEDIQTEKNKSQNTKKVNVEDENGQMYTLTFKIINASKNQISKLDAFFKQEKIKFELLK